MEHAGLRGGNVHRYIMYGGPGLLGIRCLGGYDNADLAAQMDIGIHQLTLHAGKAANGYLFAYLGNCAVDHLGNGAVAAVQSHQLVYIGGVLFNYQLGNAVYQSLEVVGLGDEVGLAVDLYDSADLVVIGNIAAYNTLGSYTGSLLCGSGKALLAKIIHCLVHIAFAGGEGLLAIHHAGAAHFAQSHYVFSGKHICLTSC